MLCIFVNSKVYEMILSICWWNYRCFMIGLSKYFDLILGNNNAIIFNSKYYRMVLFGLMLFLTITLNLVLSYVGIIGSAFATLLSITLYSLAKLLFVVNGCLYPLQDKLYSSSDACFVLFYFLGISFCSSCCHWLKSILLTVALCLY
jgi:hypothetical protein